MQTITHRTNRRIKNVFINSIFLLFFAVTEKRTEKEYPGLIFIVDLNAYEFNSKLNGLNGGCFSL